MNKNINLVEVLKDCPKGTKLYSLIHGEVRFTEIRENSEYPIRVSVLPPSNCPLRAYVVDFTKEGLYNISYDAECVLFPSKDQRDWSKWECPKLKKLKFDPKTLEQFDKVIVRLENQTFWTVDFFSFLKDKDIKCIGGYFNRCIPYNNNTKHLVGTTEEAPEYYRYWEDYL